MGNQQPRNTEVHDTENHLRLNNLTMSRGRRLPLIFFRSRFAALERIKDTPSRESTPGPSPPIPRRLTRPEQVKDNSSRTSTPNSEISSPGKSSRRKGRGISRKGGRRSGRSTSKIVHLDEYDGSSNFSEANGSIANNGLSLDINDSSPIEMEDAKTNVNSKET